LLKNTQKFYPDIIDIDLDGKRNLYEGIVNLPAIDYKVLEKEYNNALKNVDERDKKRNINGRSFSYEFQENNLYDYKSYYGDIKNCRIVSNIFE